MINPITTLVNPTTNMLVSAIWYPTIIRLIITTFSLCVNDLILYLFICYTYIIITTSYSYCRECYTRCYTRSARCSPPRIGNGNVSAHGTAPQHTPDQMQRDEVTLLAHAHAQDHNFYTAPRYNKHTTRYSARHGTAHVPISEQFPKFQQERQCVPNGPIRNPKPWGTRQIQNRFPKQPGSRKLARSPLLIYLSQHFFYFPLTNIFFQKIFYNIFFNSVTLGYYINKIVGYCHTVRFNRCA